MSGWLFALEKENEQTLGEVTTAGANQIALTDADTIYGVGDRLFISESDGSEAEYLGAVSSVSPTAVGFGRALRQSKNSGALLWTAKQSLNLFAQQSLPTRRDFRSGVELLRSLGGNYYAVEIAEPTTQMELELEGLTPATENELFDWVQTTTERGLKPFTLVKPDRTLEAVRLADKALVRMEQKGKRNLLRLPLEVEGEGEYR